MIQDDCAETLQKYRSLVRMSGRINIVKTYSFPSLSNVDIPSCPKASPHWELLFRFLSLTCHRGIAIIFSPSNSLRTCQVPCSHIFILWRHGSTQPFAGSRLKPNLNKLTVAGGEYRRSSLIKLVATLSPELDTFIAG
jgi:hypothetical protein